MKISKKILFIILLAFVSILLLSSSSNAYTNEDVIDFFNSTQTINGSQYSLSDEHKDIVKNYFTNNPVNSTQAGQIISNLQSAIAKVTATNATSLSQIPAATKTQVVSLIQSAGNVAGLNISINTGNRTISVVQKSTGAVVVNASYVDNGSGGVTVKYSAGGDSGVAGGSGAGNGSATGTAANGGKNKFVYTGADNIIYIVISALTVVAVSTVCVKKAYAK